MQIQKEILEKEGVQKMKMIEDEIWKASAQAKSDAVTYAAKATADAYEYDAAKRAKANKDLFTPEYLTHTMFHALTNNTKVYFGEKIPSMFSQDWSSASLHAGLPSNQK